MSVQSLFYCMLLPHKQKILIISIRTNSCLYEWFKEYLFSKKCEYHACALEKLNI